MGKNWDSHKGGMLHWVNWFAEIMNEAMRTMKPGAIGLVWSIPRTSHWTGMALELAGFRIIDVVHHCQGSGFPKGQDISKMIDALHGADREVIGLSHWYRKGRQPRGNTGGSFYDDSYIWNKEPVTVTAPTTPEAHQWDGWKTPALKPSVEGCWLVQKPISEPSIVRNVLKHGVGGLNIEAGRIGTGDDRASGGGVGLKRCTEYIYGFGSQIRTERPTDGRYPANLVLSCGVECDGDSHADDCPVAVIGAQSGICSSGDRQPVNKPKHNNAYGKYQTDSIRSFLGDTGTAARYFKQLPFDPATAPSIYYQSKAAPSDRSCNGAVKNVHPTVKSRHLIKYFAQLITPPNGTILDCFGGSGTTAIAAIETGFNYVLIEREAEYIEIINQRIAAVTPEPIPEPTTATPSPTTEPQQMSLF